MDRQIYWLIVHVVDFFHFHDKGSELFWIEQENCDILVNFLRKAVNLLGKVETFLGIKTTFLEGNIPILHTIGGRAYPVRHYPIAIRLRTREGYAILCIALNPQSGDFSGAILEVPFKALLHGRLSEFSRWNKARYKRSERGGNLNKSTFLSLGVGRFILGSSLVRPWLLARENLVRYKGIES